VFFPTPSLPICAPILRHPSSSATGAQRPERHDLRFGRQRLAVAVGHCCPTIAGAASPALASTWPDNRPAPVQSRPSFGNPLARNAQITRFWCSSGQYAHGRGRSPTRPGVQLVSQPPVGPGVSPLSLPRSSYFCRSCTSFSVRRLALVPSNSHRRTIAAKTIGSRRGTGSCRAPT
jgi:hypothetical protein